MASIKQLGNSYEQLLLQNASRISSIESSLRSLTWFLPGRFQDSEVASEALYSLLNILGIYHDSILHRTTASLPTPVRPSPSSHARYTRYWTSTSPTYAVLARSLTVLSHLELLLEMALRKRKGQEAGDQAVLVIESVKAVLRLALLGTTGGRGGVQPPIAEREVDPTLLDLRRPVAGSTTPVVPRVLSTEGPPPRSAADVLLGPIGGSVVADEEAAAGGAEEEMSHRDYWKGPRTGLTRPTIASIRGNAEPMVGDATASSTGGKESVQQYLLTRVLTVEDVRRDQDLVNKTMGLKKLAEIIWIMRPLLYVLAMRKYGKRTTLPFLLSLSLEYLSYSLRESTSSTPSSKASGPMLPLSSVERAESAKRAKAFWWYLARGPVWESWTKPRLEGMADKFEGKPLIGFVSTLIKDYVPLLDGYYFYTS